MLFVFSRRVVSFGGIFVDQGLLWTHNDADRGDDVIDPLTNNDWATVSETVKMSVSEKCRRHNFFLMFCFLFAFVQAQV